MKKKLIWTNHFGFFSNISYQKHKLMKLMFGKECYLGSRILHLKQDHRYFLVFHFQQKLKLMGIFFEYVKRRNGYLKKKPNLFLYWCWWDGFDNLNYQQHKYFQIHHHTYLEDYKIGQEMKGHPDIHKIHFRPGLKPNLNFYYLKSK